ncbi:MAG: hypothetical protein J6B60_02595 [Clostridia bacterium]|nr:hypothetical protein [Clostridia bacterium]
MKKIIVPNKFKGLFLPNHTPDERKIFTPEYKAEIKRRLLRGVLEKIYKRKSCCNKATAFHMGFSER